MSDEVESSEILKRKAIRLSQLELMIESGSLEYQIYYNQLESEIKLAPINQIYFAKEMLEQFLDSRKLEMSEIEQSIYFRSIHKLNRMREQRFTAHKESFQRIIA